VGKSFINLARVDTEHVGVICHIEVHLELVDVAAVVEGNFNIAHCPDK
jgi:hypothetical protein